MSSAKKPPTLWANIILDDQRMWPATASVWDNLARAESHADQIVRFNSARVVVYEMKPVAVVRREAYIDRFEDRFAVIPQLEAPKALPAPRKPRQKPEAPSAAVPDGTTTLVVHIPKAKRRKAHTVSVSLPDPKENKDKSAKTHKNGSSKLRPTKRS